MMTVLADLNIKLRKKTHITCCCKYFTSTCLFQELL